MYRPIRHACCHRPRCHSGMHSVHIEGWPVKSAHIKCQCEVQAGRIRVSARERRSSSGSKATQVEILYSASYPFEMLMISLYWPV